MTTELSETFDWLGPAEAEYHFYDNTITIYYEDTAHEYARYAETGRVIVPGVTTAVHIIDKSAALTQWSANMAVDYIRTKINSPYAPQVFTVWDIENLLEPARFNHRDYKENAAETGKIAHDWLERYIKAVVCYGEGTQYVTTILSNFPEDPRARNGCIAALDWMAKHKVRWVFAERKIYSRLYDYAGTCDGLCYVTACGDPECCGSWVKSEAGRWELVAATFVDVLCVADWKTSNNLYPEYDYQTAAYLKALNEENGSDIQYRFVTRLGKEDAQFQGRLLMPDTLESDFRVFLKSLDLYREVDAEEREEKERKSEIRQQAREDRAVEKAAEAAAIAERKAERAKKKAWKEACAALYKELRGQGHTVASATALVGQQLGEAA
jgi:hypothetical protein